MLTTNEIEAYQKIIELILKRNNMSLKDFMKKFDDAEDMYSTVGSLYLLLTTENRKIFGYSLGFCYCCYEKIPVSTFQNISERLNFSSIDALKKRIVRLIDHIIEGIDTMHKQENDKEEKQND